MYRRENLTIFLAQLFLVLRHPFPTIFTFMSNGMRLCCVYS